ncbi:MAG: hypothetical protein U5N56_12480 [Candidatus Marinimicrobia bacterium]|nr:hypothetical protein [Candidatus Neomarinimicrobiota bacterium]
MILPLLFFAGPKKSKQKKDRRFSSANWRTTKSSAFAKMQKGLAALNRCIFYALIGFSSRVADAAREDHL